MNCRKYSLLRKLHRQDHSDSGFTIVELLVVIVVIGILAAITIVSYTGISQKAVLASLQSDLSSSAQKLKMYQVEHGAYPAALDGSNCPKDSTGVVDAHYCLKPSPGNRFVYGSSSPYSTFSLTATNDNGISYQVTDNSQPTVLAAAPLSPVADWLATAQGDHYGNYYDLVSHNWATVTRAGPKTIYDPNDGRIHDVPANYLAMNPWSAYQSGGRGSAAVIEEARTNYLTNSYGAANNGSKWNGWSLWGMAGTPTTAIVSGIYGSTAQHIQYTGVAGDTSNLVFSISSSVGSFAVGEAATETMWIKGSSTRQGYIVIQAFTAANGYLGDVNTPITLSDGWTRFPLTYNNLPAATSSLEAIIMMPVRENDTIDLTIDAAQLEKGAFATSYIPTTTAAATRNADVVTVPTTGWNAAVGTYAIVHGGASQVTSGLFGVPATSGGNNYTSLSLADILYANIKDGAGVWAQAHVTGGHSAPSVYAVAFADGAPGVVAYKDGSAGTDKGIFGTPRSAIFAMAKLGLDLQGDYANGPIQRLTVYSSALSPSDVSTVTNAVKNGP